MNVARRAPGSACAICRELGKFCAGINPGYLLRPYADTEAVGRFYRFTMQSDKKPEGPAAPPAIYSKEG